MKKLLLTLASAALLTAPAMAQLNVTPLVPGSNWATKGAFQSSGQLLSGQNIWKNVTKLGHQSRVAEEVRPHKLLSYATTLKEMGELGLGPLPITYKELTAQGFNGYGFAHLYGADMLSRYVGNTIKSIEFCASMGKYTNGMAFILDATTGKALWTAPVKEIKGIFEQNGNLQVPSNTVGCDYVIKGSEGALLIGWVADYTPADQVPDPLFKENLIMPMFVDGTGAGMGANLMVRNAKGEMGIGGQYANWTMNNGKQLVQAASINIMTDGENGLKDNDVMVGQATTIRVEKSTGAGATSKVVFANMGLDPVKSVEYTFDVDGATKTGKFDFKTPVLFYQTAQMSVQAAFPATAGRAEGTLTITKVNGVADENTDNEDNETKYEALVFEKGYRRMPVVENVTSSQCVWCPVLGPAMAKVAEATGGNYLPVNVHIDMPGGKDPLKADETYLGIMGKVLGNQVGAPTSVINRENAGNPYFVASDAATAIVNSVCEANMKLTAGKLPNPMIQKISVSTDIDLTFDAPAGSYAIEYVVTEDGITSVSQLNGYATIFAGTKQQNPNASDAAIFNAMTQQYGYDFAHDKNLQDICKVKGQTGAQGMIAYNPTYTDIACSITNSEEANFVLPALKAGQKYTHKAEIPAPTRTTPKVDRSKLSVTALLIDKKSGVIVTATRAKLGETSVESAIESVEGDANVQIEVANGAFQVVAENAVAEVYSVDGKLVSSATVNGSASLPTFGKGVFVIRVVEGNKVVTKKAVF